MLRDIARFVSTLSPSCRLPASTFPVARWKESISFGTTMNAHRWNQLECLLEEALGLPPTRRGDFLSRACEKTSALRRDLAALLEAHEEAASFFDVLAASLFHPTRIGAQEPWAGSPPTVNQYQVLGTLGSGGMGVVYKAYDTRLDRVVALKTLPPYLVTNDEVCARFLHEARVSLAMNHPNVVTVHEIVTVDGLPGFPGGPHVVLVMAYHEGETLAEMIRRGPLPLPVAVEYAVQIARGLAYAHHQGVIHRDIKPANLIVTPSNLLKIVDFGLAKVEGIHLTKPGMKMGTAAYMSPEQARGENTDPRTDIWSMGVVLYEMLTGQHPFAGDCESAVLYSLAHTTPQPVRSLRRDVPVALEILVRTCLQKEPGDRYATAIAVLDNLVQLQPDLVSSAPGLQSHRVTAEA